MSEEIRLPPGPQRVATQLGIGLPIGNQRWRSVGQPVRIPPKLPLFDRIMNEAKLGLLINRTIKPPADAEEAELERRAAFDMRESCVPPWGWWKL